MNVKTKDFIETKFDLKVDRLSDVQFSILTEFDQQNLLHPEMIGVNEYLDGLLYNTLKETDPHEFFMSILMAIPQEVETMACLVLEWIFPHERHLEPMLINGLVDLKSVKRIWEEKHKNNFEFSSIFHVSQKNFFDNQDTLYKQFLFKLYKYCGVPLARLELFFEEQFQKFFYSCICMVMAIKNDDGYLGFFKCINESLSLNLIAPEENDKSSFNKVFIENEQQYITAVTFFLENFAQIRNCTRDVLLTNLEVKPLNRQAHLIGADTVSISGLSELNDLLESLLAIDFFTTDNATKRIIQKFLKNDYGSISETGGFVGLIKRQQKLLTRLQNVKPNRPYLDNASDRELELLIPNYVMDLNDLAIIHRLKFILDKAPVLPDEEKPLLNAKLNSILQSSAITFYSDIFELYFYFLLKNSGVDIKLLTSQILNGQEKSTCDYKFGEHIAADSKCVIGESGNINVISTWCNKIGKQISSTVGYLGVEFGGGIIGFRDKRFDILKNFREYSPVDKYDMLTRALLIESIVEMYSEYRRHTTQYKEKIKFLIIYYLPSTEITIEEIRSASIETVIRDYEALALFSTCYATDEEVRKISEAFSPVCPFLFKFNNALNS